MSFGVAASMFYFLKRKWIPYIIFTLFALYCHHFAFFILLVQGVWFLAEIVQKNFITAKKMFRSFLIIAIGYIPWMIPLYRQTKMVSGGFWLGKPTFEDLINLIFDYLARGNRIDINIPIMEVKLYQLALILVFITLILRNWLKNIRSTLFFLSWFLIPILVTYFISQKMQSIFFNRYMLYTIPGAMLLLGTCKRGLSSYITIISTLIIFGTIDYNYFFNPTKLPFRQYSEYVKTQSVSRDILINWNSSSHHLWETKYYQIPAPIYIPEGKGDLPYFVGTALMEESDIIRNIPDNVKRIGVVTSGPVDEVKINGYTLIDIKEVGGIKYLLLIKK
jgi:hypothetical protein